MKNIKLLLATTAILSTGLAMGVLAEGEAPATPTAATYTNRVSATLKTSIDIYSPITMDSQDGWIRFPAITKTSKSGGPVKVKVNYDGTIDYAETTAQILGNGVNNGKGRTTSIRISGGDIDARYKAKYTVANADVAALDAGYNLDGAFEDYYNVNIAEEIQMYTKVCDANGENCQFNGSLCGKVGALERYWHYNPALINSDTGGFELSFGGTFTLENGFDPTGGYARCEGSTTVTLFTY